MPGHGPIAPGHRGIDQTRRRLDVVANAVSHHFDQGLDFIEMMATAMPGWADTNAVSRCEYPRSFMDLLPYLEMAQLPIVT